MSKCQEENCRLKGFWIETDLNGNKLLCYKIRHNGRYHVQKFSLAEVLSELEAVKVKIAGA